jgi:hypothetical protein
MRSRGHSMISDFGVAAPDSGTIAKVAQACSLPGLVAASSILL